MVGKLIGKMGKLEENPEKVEGKKQRFNNDLIEEQTSDGLLKITVTANREVKNLEISEELLEDKEQLEDYLVLTLNKALTRAGAINEAELAAVAKDGMPNIPGMDLFK